MARLVRLVAPGQPHNNRTWAAATTALLYQERKRANWLNGFKLSARGFLAGFVLLDKTE